MPTKNPAIARCLPACWIDNGISSCKERKAMIPATAANVRSITSFDMLVGNKIPRTTTATGSASPEMKAHLNPVQRDPVAKYTGSATATPSGILCSAIWQEKQQASHCVIHILLKRTEACRWMSMKKEFRRKRMIARKTLVCSTKTAKQEIITAN